MLFAAGDGNNYSLLTKSVNMKYMRTLSAYLNEYSESHRHPQNIRIHNFCVPAIMWSLLGLLSLIPTGTEKVGVAQIVIVVALMYYASFRKLRLWLAMLLISFVMLITVLMIPPPLRLWICAAVFAVAWAGQFYGHKIEGKKPSFFKDLQFLLIGPVWVLHKIAPRWFPLTH